MMIPSYVRELMDRLNDAGYECYVVGGALRSGLLSLEIKDYDLTTSALPSEVKQVFSDYRTIDTGIQHGTVTVLSESHPIEITTYRTDGGYADHRRPSSVSFSSSLQEDCARRDFTINALCCDRAGTIKDFFGGREDLKLKLIRAIGDPDARFDEDALRILRALRFAAVLGFAIEENTAAALRRKKDLLSYVSMERIAAECRGFLEGRAKAEILYEYRDVFAVFLPQLKRFSDEEMKMISERLERCDSEWTAAMALLLSDLEEHEVTDAMHSLKCSNAETDAVKNMILLKDMPLEDRICLRKLRHALKVPFPVYLAYRAALDPETDTEKVSSLYEETSDDCVSLKDLCIRGSDLQALGLQGHAIREALDQALLAVMEERTVNQPDAVLAYLRDQSIF